MYHAGWSRQQIAIRPDGHAMHGYGLASHRALDVRTPLFARAIVIGESPGAGAGSGGDGDAGRPTETGSGSAGRNWLLFCCLDLGYVTHAMREGVCAALRAAMGEAFAAERLVLTCTHTHSGPGGCSHDVLYNLVTPGFQPQHVDAIVAAAAAALLAAWRSAAPTTVTLAGGTFEDAVPVAWNRSLRAYNRNPDVTARAPEETHLAIDRRMQVLVFRRAGAPAALLSLFGVHATCVGSGGHSFDGDNKGYAAAHAERCLEVGGAAGAVAIFAQATAGDVSPHYQGPGDIARRARLRGEAEYEYAERNGHLQGELALALAAGEGVPVQGPLDAVLTYVDFTAVHAAPVHAGGEPDACTADPCHGVAFFAGTRVDGPGMPAPLALAARHLARRVRARRLGGSGSPAERDYYRRLYAAHGDKDIVMECARHRVLGLPFDRIPLPGFSDPLLGELKRQVARGAVRDSAMVPTVLPLQIVRLGSLALVCAPGEFTTVAGTRLRDTVAAGLAGAGVPHTLLCTYCNDYMGYVTTREEYRVQAYEGGHTLFGQWTLAAFQTRFAALARELARPAPARTHDRHTRPAPAPAAELALRTGLPARR